MKLYIYKRLRIPKGHSNIDDPEQLATHGAQYEEKHNTICAGHHYILFINSICLNQNNSNNKFNKHLILF